MAENEGSSETYLGRLLCNPAIIGLTTFRPVALRPRLSSGLPNYVPSMDQLERDLQYDRSHIQTIPFTTSPPKVPFNIIHIREPCNCQLFLTNVIKMHTCIQTLELADTYQLRSARDSMWVHFNWSETETSTRSVLQLPSKMLPSLRTCL